MQIAVSANGETRRLSLQITSAMGRRKWKVVNVRTTDFKLITANLHVY
jgi:hypothetical protein